MALDDETPFPALDSMFFGDKLWGGQGGPAHSVRTSRNSRADTNVWATVVGFPDCLLVVSHQKRFVRRGIKEVGGERLHSTTASLKVGVHCGGGNGDGQATKFEREGDQVVARGGAPEELRKESVPEGCLHVNE